MQSELNKNINIDGYTLKDYLGAGQFGEVWLAHDTKGGNDVAIKFYVSLDERGRKEFFDEYKLASTLQQENLLRVSYLGEYSRRPYMVMDYCEKGPASNLVGTLAPKDEEVIWRFVHDVAAGLRHLHANNIVHQDIKPDNILQTSDGRFVIADFGISTNVRATMRKQSGRINNAGSVAYMPPEKFKSDSQIIKAGDLWALGVSIYELAVGKLPFAGQGGVMQLNGAEMPEIESKGYSNELNTVMQKCLQKETWDRFSAESLLEFPKIQKMEDDRVLEEEHELYKQRATIRTGKKEGTTPQTIDNTKPKTKRKAALIVGLVLTPIVLLAIVIARVALFQVAVTDSQQTSSVHKDDTITQPVQRQEMEELPIDKHEYVDLNLSSGTLWATCNIGAYSPEDNGDYFAWGEVTSKSNCDWQSYKYANGAYNKLTKYCTMNKYGNNGFSDNRTVLDYSDDVACQEWGHQWSIPTSEQFNELIDECTWKWMTVNGKKGYLVAGRNGQTIFLPAAGYDGEFHVSFLGRYWARSLYKKGSHLAYSLCFQPSEFWCGTCDRYYCFSIRPVRR